ncbi:MAG: hypothetical protein V3T81_01480, partial [Thermoanaerobaculia bacterium]
VTAGKTVIQNPLIETLAVFWARVVDYSTRPPQSFGGFHFSPSPESGAYVFYGAAKKAWLQSLPWILIPLVALLAVWLLKRSGASRQARELRAISLVIWPTLLVFSVAGFGRTDGLCFNQRYFLELVPLAAVALAWTLERYDLQRLWFLLGLLVSSAGALLVLQAAPSAAFEQIAVMRLPLALALLLAASWALAHFTRRAHALSLMLGASLMWAGAAHLADDLPASRVPRSLHYNGTRALEKARLEEPAAIFTWRGTRNVASPLQLKRDLVILDVARDAGRDAPQLVEELLQRGRHVYVIVNSLPGPLLQQMIDGRPVRSASSDGVHLVEILAEAAAASQAPQG